MTTPVSIDSVGWYILSVSSDKLIDQAKEEWGLTNGTIHSIIYELKNPPISNGQSLSSSNWNAIDTSLDNIVLYANIGYWVYVSQVPESQPEPQPEPSPEPSPEPDTPQGTVQDGYISGATVTLRNMDDTLIANYTTDSNGSFSGTGAESYSGSLVKISVTGGTDISTQTQYTNTLQYIGTLSSLGSIVVNPLSTLVADNTLAEASANGTDVTETLFNSNKATIRDNLGLTDSDMDGDFINNENATVALIVNKIELIKDSFASGFTSATTDTVSQSIASAIKNKGGSFDFNSTTDIELIGNNVNTTYGVGDESAKATRIKDYLVSANTEIDTTANDETLFLNKFTNVIKMRKVITDSLSGLDFSNTVDVATSITNAKANLSSTLIYDVFVGLKKIQVSFISDRSTTSDGENSPFILVWLKRNSGQTLADEINDVNDVLTLADDTYKDVRVNTDDTYGEFFLTNYNEQVQANIEASITSVGLDVNNISLFVARKDSETYESLRYTMQEVTQDGSTVNALKLADTSVDASTNDILTELSDTTGDWYDDTNDGFLLLRNNNVALDENYPPSYTPAPASEPEAEGIGGGGLGDLVDGGGGNAVTATGNVNSTASGSSGFWGDILSWFAANV